MEPKLVWKLLLVWLMVALVIFAVAQEWVVFVFTVTIAITGGLIYWKKESLRELLPQGFLWFILIAAVVSIIEEVWCYNLGCTMADPDLFVDLYIVIPLWTVWFSTWWWMAKKYKFSEMEVLLLAGFNGVLYEYVGTGTILQNPFGLIIAYPVISIVYSAIFVLPMLMIRFKGKEKSWIRYLVAAFLPFILSVPMAVVLFIIRSLIGF